MDWPDWRAAALARRKPDTLLRAGMIACLLVALLWFLLARLTAPRPDAALALIGRPAPSFTLRAAQNGALLPVPTRFSGESGHPTLILFFNTLCVHCLAEVSAAHEVAAGAHDPSLAVLYVDTPGENAQITDAYMARIQFDPPVSLDTGGAVARAYGAGYNPTLILVDARGTVRGVWVGETPAATLAARLTRDLKP